MHLRLTNKLVMMLRFAGFEGVSGNMSDGVVKLNGAPYTPKSLFSSVEN